MTHRPILLLLLSALPPLIGCSNNTAGLYTPVLHAVSNGGTSIVPSAVLAAEDDEMGGILTGPETAPERRPGSLGFNAGILMTTGAETDWDSAFSLGAFYKGFPGTRTAYEIGLDYCKTESSDGAVSSTLIFIRGDFMFWPKPDGHGDPGVFFLVGAGAVSENADYFGGGASESVFGGAVDLGVGFSTPRGWYLRIKYMHVIGSDNASGGAAASTGFSF
ncbi:MAG: hypothetical protein JW909_02155 [Planctomycetes bacterium]|nr:hypothetical protein [Planctomycetota bacterium]